jgi:hypothetical protein
MSDPVRSHTQQITDFWSKAFADNMSRIEAFSLEVEKLQEKAAEQAAANLDEVTRLAKESIAYTNELAAAWRKLALDGTKRTADIVAAAAQKG